MQDLIQSTAEELLSLLGADGTVSVSEDKENEAYNVEVETQDAGILIGHHGETIDALQLVLNQALFSKLDNKRVVLNIGNWRERRRDTVLGLADNIVARVLETGTPQPIYDLTPAERRIVHMHLSENTDVVTESEGEGRDRHLVVKPR